MTMAIVSENPDTVDNEQAPPALLQGLCCIQGSAAQIHKVLLPRVLNRKPAVSTLVLLCR
jgi:hypothetical protein